MAYAYLTMLDIAKMNANDKIVDLIEENVNYAPELRVLPMRAPIPGTSFNSLVRTALPTGGFRNINEGVEPQKSSYANKLVECFYFDLSLEMDTAAAQAHIDGEQAALSLEASGAMMGAMLTLGSQVWYGNGTGGDSKGFPGAVQIVDSSLVVDAGGTTATTGSSVYGLKLGPQFVQLVPGNGNVMQLGEWAQQFITRSSKELKAWKNNIAGYIGAQWLNKYAVCRIKKLTADSGKGLTDSLIADALGKCPVGYKPDVWFMSRRSCTQLQKSRTSVINASAGARAVNIENVPPRPTEAFGIPVVETDSILDTEALTL